MMRPRNKQKQQIANANVDAKTEGIDFEKLLEKSAATMKQSAWSGRRVRLHLLRDGAAVMIQSAWRGCIVRQSTYRDSAAVMIQSIWRGYAIRATTRKHQKSLVLSAVIIQSLWRGFRVRSNLFRESAAVMIQSAWRGTCARKHASAVRRAATKTVFDCTEDGVEYLPRMSLRATHVNSFHEPSESSLESFTPNRQKPPPPRSLLNDLKAGTMRLDTVFDSESLDARRLSWLEAASPMIEFDHCELALTPGMWTAVSTPGCRTSPEDLNLPPPPESPPALDASIFDVLFGAGSPLKTRFTLEPFEEEDEDERLFMAP